MQGYVMMMIGRIFHITDGLDGHLEMRSLREELEVVLQVVDVEVIVVVVVYTKVHIFTSTCGGSYCCCGCCCSCGSSVGSLL